MRISIVHWDCKKEEEPEMVLTGFDHDMPNVCWYKCPKCNETVLVNIISVIQDLPDNIIENIILDYLKQNPDKEVFPSDIAFAFNLDARKVFEISQKLKEEGRCCERDP